MRRIDVRLPLVVGALLLLVLGAAPAGAQLVEEPEEPVGGFACARAIICCPSPTQIVTHEELVACGFYPQETRLECIINVKRPTCYNGGIDTFGSFEHVLFCVDWNNNGVFAQTEVVGEVTLQMHDESAGETGPWHYAVYRDMVPPGGVRTSAGNVGLATTQTVGPTYNARAILSWNVAPTGCDYIPQWGNVLNFPIRIDPIR